MKGADRNSHQDIQNVDMRRRSTEANLVEEGNYDERNEIDSVDQSYTNVSVSQARSTLMDYPEDDTLYNFMRDELDHIMTSA